MAKVMVSLPDDLLADVDRTARQRGTTRRGLLADAARKELARPSSDVRSRAVEKLEGYARRHGWPTTEELLTDRRWRDDRDTGS